MRKGHGGAKRMADKVHKTKDTMETVCYQFYVFLCKQIDLPFKKLKNNIDKIKTINQMIFMIYRSIFTVYGLVFYGKFLVYTQFVWYYGFQNFKFYLIKNQSDIENQTKMIFCENHKNRMVL
jgi:hypothetical protein